MLVRSEQFDIRKIAESGQCFRLNETSPGNWQLVAFGRVLKIRETDPSGCEFDCSPEEMSDIWHSYFDLDTDYLSMMSQIPEEDSFVKSAAEFGKGIRILRQDPWEILISFIISQRKNIPGIKKCIEALSRQFGEETGSPGVYAFPTPKALADAPQEKLCACSLGYRLPYVRKASKMVASGMLDLEKMRARTKDELPDPELLKMLLEVPGVGPKVAQCVMLFGFQRLEAFPVDVWIDRVIQKHYDGRFPVENYPGFAGIIQQYIFYYAREEKLGGE